MPNLLKRHESVEMALIGCLMLDNLKIAAVSEILTPADFSCSDIGGIYKVILSQWSAGHTADALTVSAELDMHDAGTAQEAYASTGSAASAMFLAEQVRDASTRRKLHLEASRAAKAAKENDAPILDILEKARDSINGIGHVEKKRTAEDDILGLVKSSQDAAASESGTVGIPTGYRTLDNMTSGLIDSDLWVIAARTSLGKTALALNIIYNILKNTDKSPVLFTAEMSPPQIWLRLLSQELKIDSNRILRGDLNKGQWSAYIDASQKMAEEWGPRLFCDPKSAPTPGYINSIARQKQQEGKCDIVFTDYLGLMTFPGYTKEYSIITECAKSQKALAKDLNVPAVLLAQIGRGPESRDGMTMPVLTDLKSSGEIENSADKALFIHKETRDASIGVLNLAKHRGGPLGQFKVLFDGPTTTFTEV